MNWDTDWDGHPIYYDRQGQPMTMHQWAEKFQDEDYTHIARDVIGPDSVATGSPWLAGLLAIVLVLYPGVVYQQLRRGNANGTPDNGTPDRS